MATGEDSSASPTRGRTFRTGAYFVDQLCIASSRGGRAAATATVAPPPTAQASSAPARSSTARPRSASETPRAAANRVSVLRLGSASPRSIRAYDPSTRGSAAARWALVEAAWSVVLQPGPLHTFYDRTRARRGHAKAIVATARKLAILFGACSPAARTTHTNSHR